MGLKAKPKSHGGDRQRGGIRSARGATLTVLGYLSIGDAPTQSALLPAEDGSLALRVPADRQEFAAGCLALGIGSEGGGVVAALAVAPWFSHLRQAALGPVRGTGREAESVMTELLRHVRGPHVVSVALPKRADHAEVDAACRAGRVVRRQGAFTVATVSQPGSAAMVELGATFDCVVEGDGSLHHHWYPARTVTEPQHGRIACYDLHDVCSMWAGRVGIYGTLSPTADALHVEVSTGISTLAEVDGLAHGMASCLDNPERLRLFNHVSAARSDATAVSFLDSPVVRQERAASRQGKMGDGR